MSNALEINKCILDVGKTRFRYNIDSKDYTFNGKTPRSIPKDYFSQIHKKFLSLLLTQLKENSPKELLNKYIETAKNEIKSLNTETLYQSVTFKDRKAKGISTDENDDDFEDINIIISIQKSVLLKIHKKLEEEIEFIGYKTSADYQKENEIVDLDTNNILFSDSGRVTFKMSKIKAMMLIFILEETKLIQFENNKQRRKFIENNFNYSEYRENSNQDESKPMIDVISDISRLKGPQHSKSNNKLLSKLLKELEETIHLYEFKS
jgi:hypothetical protein